MATLKNSTVSRFHNLSNEAIPADIAASQAAYAARKWSTAVRTDDFSGSFRFSRFRDAVGYAAYQMLHHTPRHGKYSTFECEIEGPGGMMALDQVNRFVGVALAA
jgi:hypothetical protein